MSKQFNVAVVGATGAVGEVMLSILAERDFPVSEADRPGQRAFRRRRR